MGLNCTVVDHPGTRRRGRSHAVALVGACLLLTSHMSPPVSADEAGVQQAIRQTVARALPYMMEHGNEWISQRECVSCHQVPSMLWGLHAADRAGFDVESASLDAADHWSWAFCRTNEDMAGKLDGGGRDTMAFMILGRPREACPEEVAATIRTMATMLVEKQRDDGSWKPDGQLAQQKRPLQETTHVTTAWILLALRSIEARESAVDDAIGKARVFLSKASDGVSSEWHAVRLLLSVDAGDEAAVRDGIARLKTLQHPDGGWGWLTDDPSDALATGQVLYALGVAGLNPSTAHIDRAWRFLSDTQEADGSWLVHGTKRDAADAPQPTAIDWGTAWAVIGVCATLSPAD